MTKTARENAAQAAAPPYNPMLDSDDDESIPPPPPPPPQSSSSFQDKHAQGSTEVFHDHEIDPEGLIDDSQVAKPVKKWRLLKKEAEHVLVPQEEEEQDGEGDKKRDSAVLHAGHGAGGSPVNQIHHPHSNGPTLQGHFRGIHNAQEFEEEEAGMDDIEVPSSSVVARMNWSEKQKQKKRRRFRWIVLFVLGFAALMAIIVGSVVGSRAGRGSQRDDGSAVSSTNDSSNLDTPGGKFLLEDPTISQSTKDALADPNSSASQALDWMIRDNVANQEYASLLTEEGVLAGSSPSVQEEFKQRFAAASLGKALSSDGFVNGNGWMSQAHVCDWEGLICVDGGGDTGTGGDGAATVGARSLQTTTTTTTSNASTVPSGRVVSKIFMTNNNLTGRIPPEISMFSSVTQVVLYSNQLTGSIPAELYQMTQLTGLDLYDNDLTGELSDDMGNWKNMVGLYLSKNNLVGSVPSTIQDMANLESVWLDDNQLTGPIPAEMGNMPMLKDVLLSNNQLTGGIPMNLGNAPLENLELDNNQALFVTSDSPNFPTFLLNMQNLQRLSLRQVSLQGPIPTMVQGSFPSLTKLYLDSNLLTGSLENNIAWLQKLEKLTLSDNVQLGGAIPTSLGRIPNLKVLDLSNCRFEGTVPPELAGATLLEELYLNRNYLQGDVPTELSALVNLKILRLDSNQGMGNIPTSICEIGIPTLLAGCEATCTCCTDTCARVRAR